MLNVRVLSKLLIALIVFCVFYNQTITGLVSLWSTSDGTQSHGFVIVFISLLYIYKKLEVSGIVSSFDNIAGFVVLFLASLFWFVAASINIEIIQQFLLLPILFALHWSVFGWASAMSVSGAIFYLIFAVPVWDYLTPLLVDLSTAVVTWFISLTSIPAYINGNIINLSSGSLVIADGCSGLRYLVIALALAGYAILSSHTSLKNKLAIVFVAIVLGLFVNWLRIFILVLIAHYTDMQSSLVEDHETFGWVLFALVCVPIVLMVRRLEPIELSKKEIVSKTPLLFVFMAMFALSIGPSLLYFYADDIKAPNLNNWEDEGFNLYTNANGIIRKPKSALALQKDLVVNDSVYKGYVFINWQNSKDDDLVPYWPKPYDSVRWQLNHNKAMPLEKNAYSLMSLERLHYGQVVCMAIKYEVGGVSTENYTIAKLLQIPASVMARNYFIASVIVKPISKSSSCEGIQAEFTIAFEIFESSASTIILE